MTSPLTGPLRGVADTLLRTFGDAATLRRPGADGEYDTSTGAIEGGGSATDFACEVQLVDFRDAQIDGTLVKMGDKKALVSALRIGIDPDPQSDVLIVGSETWQIVRDMPATSGATAVLHELHVRR